MSHAAVQKSFTTTTLDRQFNRSINVSISVMKLSSQVYINISPANKTCLKSLVTSLPTKFSSLPLSSTLLSSENVKTPIAGRARPNPGEGENPQMLGLGQYGGDSDTNLGHLDEKSTNLAMKIAKKYNQQVFLSWNLDEMIEPAPVEMAVFKILKQLS